MKPAYRVLGLQRVHQTIRGQSASKEELLRHVDEIDFCQEGDKIIIDGIHIVRS